MISRRNFIKGLILAPAIVSAKNIMPIWVPPVSQQGIYIYDWELCTYVPKLTVSDYERFVEIKLTDIAKGMNLSFDTLVNMS